MKNRLNDLTSSEWLYFTNTLWETSYPPDPTHKLRKQHGAMKPPEAMRDLVRFFTKKEETVLDPFAGVGSTLLGAELCGREAVGIELNPRWIDVYEEIRVTFGILNGRLVRLEEYDDSRHLFPLRPGEEKPRPIQSEIRLGDCLELMGDFAPESMDAIICDPPYGAQHEVRGFQEETNFDMFNPGAVKDFGNAPGFDEYLDLMARFGMEALRILRGGRYLVVMIGDRYRNGEYVPLGYRLAGVLRRAGFKFKGVKLWWNKVTQRPLKPYALGTCFVPNITHQNIVIMRKE
jgi:DNA modification methylase